ncbi:NADH dehydrogenase subunit J [Palleronia marisminoris]|uniref:NADH-quinone oxidoreductase subunit J n=1 Tax=Palleronia marisminoris TaxID=315423 RepID=A0A1Y5TG63_9RHOB|nr:NADH-quinone oxidoreductase subunit J [Palleronia marisminoris]SFH34875.1 NADH dehydrogenase subunit J [Palleronia marisminoris]SLN59652.1 NADH-quinone oxidoreductase subunit J [Palleronia marisminoris]
MTPADFAFYVFAILVVAAGLFTVVARHPVHSVLWLILAFLSSAGLFVLMGAEFVAMLLVIVYVGAVAVLFLFVVMMLDVDFASLKAEMAKFVPIALLIGVVILMQLGIVFGVWEASDLAAVNVAASREAFGGASNTQAIGQLVYDEYLLLFQLSGLILLVAMIGAIVLTLRHRTDVKRQDVVQQIMRDPKKTMEMRDVKSGQGLG